MPHVDLGAGLLQYADNRPTITTLVGMVAVGMVRVGMVSVGMVGVGMVPAPRHKGGGRPQTSCQNGVKRFTERLR